MSNRIQIKRTAVVGREPTSGQLVYGELALNYADGRLFYKDSNDSVQTIGGVGATGPAGVAGVTGPTGPAGPVGVTGPSGVSVVNIDGGHPWSVYSGITSIDCGTP